MENRVTNRIIALCLLECLIFSLYAPPLVAHPATSGMIKTAQQNCAPSLIAEFTVTPQDGGGYRSDSVSIEIPKGAVLKKTVIRIERLPAVEALDPAMANATAGASGYRFLPDGQRFVTPVKITLPYDVRLNRSEAALNMLSSYYFDEKARCWRRLERISLNREQATITSLSTHFSDMIASTLTLPEGPQSVDFDVNSIKMINAADPTAEVARLQGLEAGPFGAAEFLLPLRIPRGRGKATPRLALSYSSEHRNGWMGRGFDIYVPAISIDTRFGLPQYQRKDTYLLEGEELVAMNDADFEARVQFRQRREGRFARIIWDTVEGHWEVTDKDGTMRIYGLKNGWSGKGPERVDAFRWYLSRIMDANGNTVEYEYETDEENNYTYLHTIRYSGRIDYQEVALDNPDEDGLYSVHFTIDSEIRPDRRIDARGRYLSKLTGRLEEVEVAYDGLTIRRYRFTYEPNLFGQTQLTAVAEYDSAGKLFYRYGFDYFDLETMGEGFKAFGSDEFSEEQILLAGPQDVETFKKERTRSLGASLYTGVSVYSLAWKRWKFYWKRFAHFGVRGGFADSASRTEELLLDLSGDGVPDALSAYGRDLDMIPLDWVGRSTLNESSLGRLPEELSRTEGNSKSVGLSAGLMPLSGAATWQWGQSRTKSSFIDFDGDGLIDFASSGDSSYRRNSGGGFEAESIRVDTAASSMSFNELTEKQARNLEKSYYLQEPVRKWKAYRGGVIEIENSVGAVHGSSPTVEAKTYIDSTVHAYNGDINSIGDPQTIENVEVDRDAEIFFHLDTLGDSRNDSVDWRTKIRYRELKFFDEWNTAAFFRDPPSPVRNSLPWNDGRLELIYKQNRRTDPEDSNYWEYSLKSDWRNFSNSLLRGVYASLYEHGYAIPGKLDQDLFMALLGEASNTMHSRTVGETTYYSLSNRSRLFFSFRYAPEEKAFYRISPAGDSIISSNWNAWYHSLSPAQRARLREAVYPRFLDGEEILPANDGSAYWVRRSAAADLQEENELYDSYSPEQSLGTRNTASGILLDREYPSSADDPEALVFLRLNAADEWELLRLDGESEEFVPVTVAESGSILTVSYLRDGVERKYTLTERDALLSRLPKETYEGEVSEAVLAGMVFTPDTYSCLAAENWNSIYAASEEDERFLLDLFYEEESQSGDHLLKADESIMAEEIEYLRADAIHLVDAKSADGVDSIFNRLSDGRSGITTLSSAEYTAFTDFFADPLYAGNFFSELVTSSGDSLYVPRSAMSAEEEAEWIDMIKQYRRDVELFPYYRANNPADGDAYTLRDGLSIEDENIVRTLLSGLKLSVYKRLDRSLIYRSDAAFLVTDIGLRDKGVLESLAPVISGTSSSLKAGRIRIPLIQDERGLEYREILFRQPDSQRDYSAEELVDYSIIENLELNAEIIGGAAAADFEGLDQEEPPREAFRGGGNGWFYGAWTGYHDWDEKKLLDTPGYTNDISDVTEADDPALRGQEPPPPPYFLPMTPNEPDLEFISTGRDPQLPVAPDAWLGRLSEYSDAEWDADGTMTFTQYRFAAFIDESTMSPERYGGDTFYRVPRTETAAGSSSLSSLRKSKSESFDLSGGVDLLGGKVSHNNGSSWQYRDFQDINGDRIPDVIIFPSDGGMNASVLFGSINPDSSYQLSRPHAIAAAYDYIVKSDNDGYGVGASPASTGGGLESGIKDGKWTSLDVAIAEAPPGASLSFNAAAGETVTKVGLVDINGDGLPDQLSRHGGGALKTALNTGAAFPSDSQTEWDNAMHDLIKNGMFGATKRSEGIAYSNVGSFGESVGYSTGGQVSIGATGSLSGSVNRDIYSLIDFNGDGLLDQVMKRPETSYFEVRFNLGDRFASTTTKLYKPEWTNVDLASMMISSLQSNISTVIESFTGLKVPNELNFVAEGIGSWDYEDHFGAELNPLIVEDVLNYANGLSLSFGSNLTFKIPFWNILVLEFVPGVNGSTVTTSSSLMTRDITGDGLPDHILRVPGEDTIRVMENRMGKVGLLKSVNTPFGGRTEIDYQRVGNTSAMPQSRWVLKTVTMTDGFEGDLTRPGSHSYTSRYEFANGVYDRQERIFCGFGTVRKIRYTAEDQIASVREDIYAVDPVHPDNFYRRGLLKGRTVYDKHPVLASDEKTYQRSETVYDFPGSPITTSFFPKVREERHYQYDADTGESVAKHMRYNQYDPYGNVLELTDFGVDERDDDNMSAVISYANLNDDRYLHAHPKSIEVTDSSGTIRKRTGSYDQRGNLIELKQYYTESKFTLHELEYDPTYGNLTAMEDPRGHTIEVEYDPTLHTFPTEIRSLNRRDFSAPTYTSFMSWNYLYGKEATLIDQNGNLQTRSYDTFGRMTKVFSPYDDTGGMPAVAFGYTTPDNSNSTFNPWHAITVNKVSREQASSDDMLTAATADGLGRIIQTAKEGEVHSHEQGGGSTVLGWNCSGMIVYDGAGRVIQEGQTVFLDEPVGSGLNATPPSLVGLKRPTIRNYDAVDRPVLTQLPTAPEDKAITIFMKYGIEGDSLLEKVTDPNGNIAETLKDVRGNAVEVRRSDAAETLLKKATYTYNPLGELLQSLEHDLEQNKTYPVEYSYDLLGRRTSITSPDAGHIVFEYDAAGNLTRKVDSNLRAQGKAKTYQYDGHNRLTTVLYPFTDDTTYEYGGKSAPYNGAGRLIRRSDASGTIDYRYGKLGEVTYTERSLNRFHDYDGHKNAVTQFRYDYLGRLEEMTYPDGEVVVYDYDAGGQVTRITSTGKGETTDYVTKIGYDEYGQRNYIAYGNGVETVYTYDPYRRWLKSISTVDRRTGTEYQNIEYEFDAVGNIEQSVNNVFDYRTEQNYSYDALYQLKGATGTYNHTPNGLNFYTSTYTQDYTFDTLGNFTNKQSTQRYNSTASPKHELNYNLDYTYYEGSAHRAEWIGDIYFSYDANGNLIEEREGGPNSEVIAGTSTLQKHENLRTVNRGFALVRNPEEEDEEGYIRSYTWDEENRLLAVSDANTDAQFRYDADNQRTIKYSRGTETLYFGQFSSGVTLLGVFRQSKHIYLGETRIATRLNIEGENTSGYELNNTYYYHADHLGSAQHVTKEPNTQLGEETWYEHIEYTPYGELWEEQQSDSLDMIPFRFTGKEWDEETKLYYYGARYLDPKRGRWLSSDPAMDGLNWYGYCENNPLIFTDPDGLQPVISSWRGTLITPLNYAGSPQRRDQLMTSQDSTRANDRYAKGQGGNFNMPADWKTWCNQSTYDVSFATGFIRSVFGGGADRSNWRDGSYNTNANAAARTLAANAKVGERYAPDDPRFVKSVTAENAQKLANDGFTVIAAWENASGEPGHLATVRPDEGEYNDNLGPRVSNIGDGVGLSWVREAFGVDSYYSGTAENMDDIKYYYYPNQDFEYDATQSNNRWGYND